MKKNNEIKAAFFILNIRDSNFCKPGIFIFTLIQGVLFRLLFNSS